jgi:hypothetical protein
MSPLTEGHTLGLRGLHLFARMALRVRTPLRAKALVDQIGSHLPGLRGVEDARAAVRALFPAGSCLSRALTIAATLPGAEVVIGVDAWSTAQLSAHAWLEIDHVRVDTRPGTGDMRLPDELARLPAQGSRLNSRR